MPDEPVTDAPKHAGEQDVPQPERPQSEGKSTPTSDEPEGGADEDEDDPANGVRGSRSTGGDAPAAGSIAEREAVAANDDNLFSDDR